MHAVVSAPVVVGLDGTAFDAVPACEAIRNGAPCGNGAAWALRSRCCGTHSLACQPCVDLTARLAPVHDLVCQCGFVANTFEGMFACTRL